MVQEEKYWGGNACDKTQNNNNNNNNNNKPYNIIIPNTGKRTVHKKT